MAITHEEHRVRDFSEPDEVREFVGHGHADAVDLDGQVVLLGTFEPGWRWSVDVGPIAGTATCQAEHLGYVLSGRMRIHLDNGDTLDIGPGEVVHIPPGHDAETLGDEAVVMVDFGSVAGYAKG